MGNICRSPTAEGAFRSIVEKKTKSQYFEIDSAGTHAYHIGNSPDQRSQQAAIKNGVDAVYTNDETRKKFEIMAREVFKKFKAVLPDPVIEQYQGAYKAIDIIYKKLQENRESADIADVMKALQGVVGESIQADIQAEAEEIVIDISKIDFDKLQQEFAKSEKKNTAVHMLKDRIEAKLEKMLNQNPSRIDYYQRYQEIIAEYNKEKDRATIEQIFHELLTYLQGLSEEDERAMREGLSEEYLAVYDLLKKPDLNEKDKNKVKETAKGLLDELKHKRLSVEQWKEKTSTIAAVKSDIYDYLFMQLPPETYSDNEVDLKSGVVFQHIYSKYPSSQSNVYYN